MTHVKHMGFELELKHTQIVAALAWVPKEQLPAVIAQLAPSSLRRAVADSLGLPAGSSE